MGIHWDLEWERRTEHKSAILLEKQILPALALLEEAEIEIKSAREMYRNMIDIFESYISPPTTKVEIKLSKTLTNNCQIENLETVIKDLSSLAYRGTIHIQSSYEPAEYHNNCAKLLSNEIYSDERITLRKLRRELKKIKREYQETGRGLPSKREYLESTEKICISDYLASTFIDAQLLKNGEVEINFEFDSESNPRYIRSAKKSIIQLLKREYKIMEQAK